MKKKSHIPKDIEDLANIYYDPSRVNDRRRHEGIVQNISSGQSEEYVKRYLNLRLEKIREESGVKTPDFISDDRKYVIEVTRIEPPFEPSNIYDGGLFDPVRKINSAIDHALEKDLAYLEGEYNAPQSSYRYLLVAEVDFRVFFFFGFFERLKELIGGTRLKESDLDGMIFIPEPIGTNSQMPKPVGYFKDPCYSSLVNGVDCRAI